MSVWSLTLYLCAAPAGAAEKDPHEGHFTLEEATAGLEGQGPLTAVLDTSKGQLDCRLFEKESPITVANFVGLARGLRSFLNPRTHQWEKRPYYDGLLFHRVIPGFMVQTGDFSGKGSGEAGYRIPNEHSPKLKFNRPGLLGMANYGPDTNSAQFFITEAAANHLNGAYTIFGECKPAKVVREIAKGPRDMNDRPRTPVTLTKVTISRAAARKRR
ncbi:MAG: peptidylprolyl isomerase [Deltaproteobacteria bacterium]|nr:peptidylprolyl isomerase [Deltaproteobacteria bacterium]